MNRYVVPDAGQPRSVSVLGATGSVGCSTAEVIRERPELFDVKALTAWSRVDELVELAIELDAELAVIGRDDLLGRLRDGLAGTGIEAAAGQSAIIEAAERPASLVLAAIVGAAGLEPTLAAVRRGAMVGLANKECLICAGELMLAEVDRHDAVLLPVDSEHSAMFQALAGSSRADVERLVLTASGGPFRDAPIEAMAEATLEDALSHPSWSMGAKITIDCATMMNKGLELIEAHHLFGVEESRIDMLVHPQSFVHSLVTFKDGSTLAQMSPPSMRVPIAYALGWPGRLELRAAPLDLAALGRLTFAEPDLSRFPALRLARQALRSGGAAPIVLNAANEVAVAAFLDGRIGFLDIVSVVDAVLGEISNGSVTNLEDVMGYDAAGRRQARKRVDRLACMEA